VRKFDSVQFIIDHVGMGVDRAALPNQLQTTIEQLLTYATYPNVATKWGHAPRRRSQCLSHLSWCLSVYLSPRTERMIATSI
jgi:hypothetical protein